MKWSNMGLTAVFMLCTAAAFAVEAVPLEQALDEAAAAVSSNVKAGSTIVVVGISSGSNELSEFMADELSFKIYSLKKLKVAERKSLDAIKKEMNFQLSGEVSDESIKQIGNITGAETVIVGTFKNQRSHYLLTVKALNVSTAIVEAMHRAQVAQSETIVNAMAQGGSVADYPLLDTGAYYTSKQQFAIGMENFFAFGLGSYLAGYTADGIGLTVTHILGNALFWSGLGSLIVTEREYQTLGSKIHDAESKRDHALEYKLRKRQDAISRGGPIAALTIGVFVEFGAFLYGCIVPIWYKPQYSVIGSVLKNIKVDMAVDSKGELVPRLAYKIEF